MRQLLGRVGWLGMLCIGICFFHSAILYCEADGQFYQYPNYKGGLKYPKNMDQTNPNEKTVEDANYWRTVAVSDLVQKLKQYPNIGRAKNIIFFMGGGTDAQTHTAARILKGQEVDHVQFGEEAKLYLGTFPYTGFSKTYCVDAQVADAACAATAMLCGIKCNSGTFGVTSDVKRGNCTASKLPQNQVSCIMEWAQAAGKSTGFVTTTNVTDGSVGPLYASTAERLWETDTAMRNMGADPDACDDIAKQMVTREVANTINVIMGGGRAKFLPNTVVDSEGVRGEREDDLNLVKMWKAAHIGKRAKYVESVTELAAVDTQRTEYLLGLYSPTDIAYLDQIEETGDPRLYEMTKKAIEMLKKNTNGFFLFVEGGRVDHAHHQNWFLRALWEMIEFDRAVQVGDQMLYDGDTLVLYASDHAHVMSFSGYAPRGSKMTGFGGMGLDKMPYSILNYNEGPGWMPFTNNMRHNISNDPVDSFTYREVPLVPLVQAPHSGEDGPIFAKGPFAHLITGVHEQNFLAYVMGYAACIGPGPTYCKAGGGYTYLSEASQMHSNSKEHRQSNTMYYN